MAFLIFAHVNPHHGVLVIEEKFSQSASQFGFSDTSWSEENKGANRAVGVLQTGTGAPNRIGYSHNRFVLPNYALMQAFFHMEQFCHFAFHQTADWNSGPFRHNGGNFFTVNFFFKQCPFLLLFLQFGFSHADLFLQFADCAIAQARGLFEVSITFGLFHFRLSLIEFFFQLFESRDAFFFCLPLRSEGF